MFYFIETTVPSHECEWLCTEMCKTYSVSVILYYICHITLFQSKFFFGFDENVLALSDLPLFLRSFRLGFRTVMNVWYFILFSLFQTHMYLCLFKYHDKAETLNSQNIHKQVFRG